MAKSIISEGKTTSEAIEKGLKKIGLPKELVDIKVIEENKKSLVREDVCLRKMVNFCWIMSLYRYFAVLHVTVKQYKSNFKRNEVIFTFNIPIFSRN